MRLSKYIATILCLRCIHAQNDDPWQKAEKLMSQLTAKPNSIENPTIDTLNGNDVNIFIPTGYNETYEQLRYETFWTTHITKKQLDLNNWLIESSDIYNNSNATYMLSQIYMNAL
ncbi:ERAD-associated protein [Maudiozyma exigua]|uniref:ERAD-associated protein n=1 Tax=Maudiozyma exigua TaxID=34358 RepID=A0A9P6W9Y9_MAUEX|nr:ERAD-associated protein [Kazachstania exigua]